MLAIFSSLREAIFHHRSNVEKAMEFFRKDGVRLADISSRDILVVAGSIKTTLILLEAVVMRYQVSTEWN